MLFGLVLWVRGLTSRTRLVRLLLSLVVLEQKLCVLPSTFCLGRTALPCLPKHDPGPWASQSLGRGGCPLKIQTLEAPADSAAGAGVGGTVFISTPVASRVHLELILSILKSPSFFTFNFCDLLDDRCLVDTCIVLFEEEVY